MVLAPRGRGIYVRDPDFTFRMALGLDHAFVHGDSSRLDVRAKGLRDAGVPFWLYALPDAFSPSAWEASVRRLAARAHDVGAAGFIGDLENGWNAPGLDAAAREAGDAIGSAKGHNGLTSYPLFERVRVFGQGSRGRVWGGPQPYLKETLTRSFRTGGRDGMRATVRAWIGERWSSALSAPIVPAVSIAPLPGSPDLADPAWDAYFDSFPGVRGATAWPVGSAMARQWDSFRPGLPIGNRAVSRAELATGLPIGAIAAACGVTVALLAGGLFYVSTRGA